jgi:hypothetical protein
MVMGPSPALLSRYMTPLIPALAWLEAELICAVVRRVRPNAIVWAPLGLAALMAIEPSVALVRHYAIARQTDTRVLAERWLAEHAPAGSRVAVVGTQFWIWGAPRPPANLRNLFFKQTDQVLEPGFADYVVTHDHALFSSKVDAKFVHALEARAVRLVEFDPFIGEPSEAVFEPSDAYYVPISGFAAVERPGPVVTIYRMIPTRRAGSPSQAAGMGTDGGSE